MPLIHKPAARDSDPVSQPDTSSQLAHLVTGDDEARWAAARAAAGLPDGAKALKDALARETNSRVREAMFTSLARIASPASIETVLPYLRVDDAHIRTQAWDALAAMHSAVWPYFRMLLRDEDPDVRILSCELARGMPGTDAAGALAELLDSEQTPNVCAAAIEVLAEIGDARVLPALARCEARFSTSQFLSFSLKVAADRIHSKTSPSRG
jgi:HEAT repeat protein